MLVRYIVVCEASLLNSRSNNVSLIEIIEELLTTALPGFVDFHVVCLFEKEKGDPDVPDGMGLKIELNGVTVREIPVSMNFAGQARSRFFAEVRSIKLSTAGRLDVKVLSNGNQIGSWWINVLVSGQESNKRLH